MGIAILHVVLLALSASITAVLAAYAWHNRVEHGARAFFGLMVSFTLLSAAHLVGLLTFDPWWRVFWENFQWVGTAAIPVFWTLFALKYTGHDEMVDGRTVAAMSVVPLVTILLVWTNWWHGLVWTDNALRSTDGLAILTQEFGPWFWVFLLYTYGLIVVGSFLLLRLIWVSDYLYADQSVLLVVGVAVPVFASVLTVFDLTPIREPTLDITPYSFTVSGLAFGYALFRHRLFDLVPATRRLGRSAAIRDLEDGVVIVDTDLRVIYCNGTAADVFGCEPSDAVTEPVLSFVDEQALDFDAEDALAEWDRDGAVYEVRTSPIHEPDGRHIGHTLVVQDITARKRRERRVARQRDELEQLEELNAVVRGVNRALVSATTRDEIEQAVCDHLIDVGRYRTVCVADVPTWEGDADRWTVAGEDEPAVLPSLGDDPFDGDGPAHRSIETASSGNGDTPDRWTVVPLVNGRTVYGGLGLLADRHDITDREHEVLAEVGELIGHAIDAVANRRLLSAGAVVELEFRSEDDHDALLSAASRAGCELALEGVVPDNDGGHLAYVRVGRGTPSEAARALRSVATTRVRTVRENDDGGLLEWGVPKGTIVALLLERGANVVQASAESGVARVRVELPAEADPRALADRLQEAFPDTRLEAKRELDRPIERADDISGVAVEDLTDRQREVLEVAYRAGYFD